MKWMNKIGIFLLACGFSALPVMGTELTEEAPDVQVESQVESQVEIIEEEIQLDQSPENSETPENSDSPEDKEIPMGQEQAKLYIQVIQDYIQAFGLGVETDTQEGLYQSRLLDMNGDGNLELLLFYIESYHSTNGLLGQIEIVTVEEGEVVHLGDLSVQNALTPGQGNRFVLVEQGDSWAILEQVIGESPGNQYFMEQYHHLTQGELVGSLGDYSIQSWTDISIGQDCLIFNGDLVGETGVRHPVLSALSDLEYYAVYEPAQSQEEAAAVLPQTAVQHLTTDYGSLEYQYLQILQGYEDSYGRSDGSSMGLASARLLDLDGNGLEELVLTLATQVNPLALRTEVWEILDGKATRTFVHSQGQKFYYTEDWRDRGSLYSYGDGWVFITSGGGGSDYYTSYDRVFLYESGGFSQVDESYFMRYHPAEGEGYEFVAYVTGLPVEKGQGDLVSQVLPSWYSGFQRIQSQYFSGAQVELFYIDKSTYGWVTDSVLGDLEVAVHHQGDWIPQGDVIIPQEHSQLGRYEVYEGILLEVENSYGTSSGLDEGLAFSYLLDLTGDGAQELILGYCTKLSYFGRDDIYLETDFANSNGFTLEIWGYEGEEALLLWSRRLESQMAEDGESQVYSLDLEAGTLYLENSQGLFAFDLETGEFVETDGKPQDSLVDLLSIVQGRRMFWDSHSSALDLGALIALSSGSPHYYGYEVVYDSELVGKITTALDLSQQVLALYQVTEGMYFLILAEDGQSGLLVALDDHGTWQQLERGMLSAQALELALMSYTGVEIPQAEVELQPRPLAETALSQEENVVVEVALVVTLAMAFGLWLLVILVRRKS